MQTEPPVPGGLGAHGARPEPSIPRDAGDALHSRAAGSCSPWPRRAVPVPVPAFYPGPSAPGTRELLEFFGAGGAAAGALCCANTPGWLSPRVPEQPQPGRTGAFVSLPERRGRGGGRFAMEMERALFEYPQQRAISANDSSRRGAEGTPHPQPRSTSHRAIFPPAPHPAAPAGAGCQGCSFHRPSIFDQYLF